LLSVELKLDAYVLGGRNGDDRRNDERRTTRYR